MDIVDILTNIMLMCVANMDCKSDEDNETEAILDKASISNVGVKARARVFTFRVLITMLCDAVVTGLIVTSFEGIFHFFIHYICDEFGLWVDWFSDHQSMFIKVIAENVVLLLSGIQICIPGKFRLFGRVLCLSIAG